MNQEIERRAFLAASTGVAAGLAIGPRMGYAQAAESPFKTKLHKALIVGRPTEVRLKKIKEGGFDGVEAGIVSPKDAEACRAVAEKLGMKIHSVLRGWASFNSRKPDQVQQSITRTEDALRAAQGYGADAVLLVPCRIGGMKMPRPWEYSIDFNEATGHIKTVTAGDNAPFEDYIKAHNHAVDTSRAAIKKLIPVAEKTGVVIALENVWNNLWSTPQIFANFVASFKSKWVQAYFDIGNHVKYARPEEWILALGKMTVKVHVKDFALNQGDPNGQGKFVNIRDGSVRWPVVRQALERVGYNGWMTIEGGNLSVEEHAKRLDLIVAGK